MAEIGDVVATYRLVEPIAAGGMGTVYRAHDERLDRDVALKLLAPQLSEDASFKARFEREAHIAGGLRHPNIVPVFDAGEWNGQLYLAMLLVEGPTLAQVIKRDSPLPLRRVTNIIGQVASALDAAHARGIVHRDVKPGNILLLEHAAADGDDHAYLADFGLTRSSNSMTQMTRAGTFLGTLDYIAPEQLNGEHVDGRADQYALACTAYEMLASSPPFKRDTEVALISAHLYSPPPQLSDVRPDLPPALGAALARALSKDPEERYPSDGAFALALSRAIDTPAASATTVLSPTPVPSPPGPGPLPPQPPQPPQPPRKGNGQNIAIAFIAVLLVSLIAVGAVLALNNNNPGATAAPQNTLLAAGQSTEPLASPSTALASVDVIPPPTAHEEPTIVPGPTLAPGITPDPFPWHIAISSTASSVPASAVVTVTAVTNRDVSLSGYVIEIFAFRQNDGSKNLFNHCSQGTTCSADAGRDEAPQLVTYFATVGPSGGPVLAQATTDVFWYVDSATPPPIIPTVIPATPPPPPPVGPQLASGDLSVSHTLVGETDGGQDFEESYIPRTYTLADYDYFCASAYDCTARFVTDENNPVKYVWDGSTFQYGPNSYSDGRKCSGVGGSYNVQQTVSVTPADWDGVSPITHLIGTMTLVGTVTPTGQAWGCSNYELDYATDISHY